MLSAAACSVALRPSRYSADNSCLGTARKYLLLIGKPTRRRRIKLAVRYAMPGMNGEETAGYVTRNVKLAARPDPLFSDDAVTLIHATSRGLPRAVSNLAIQAIVDESAARTAAAEVTAD
jgi:type II secretory pathway predicted ATPase ExeA